MNNKCSRSRPKSEEWRKNHSEAMKGHSVSEETKKKIGIANKGKNNGMWKEQINYISLHQWLEDNLPKKGLCEICLAIPPYDIANITGLYNRDFENWKRLCRKCHMLSDGRLERLLQNRPIVKRDIQTGRFIKNG